MPAHTTTTVSYTHLDVYKRQVQVTIDPTVFQGQQGTVTGLLTISSQQAVNLPPAVRLLVNNQGPNERGTWTDVPGTLVDLLADPSRDQFYVLRQDKNEVLVYDGSDLSLLAILRTGTTPTRMALTPVSYTHLDVYKRQSLRRI